MRVTSRASWQGEGENDDVWSSPWPGVHTSMILILLDTCGVSQQRKHLYYRTATMPYPFLDTALVWNSLPPDVAPTQSQESQGSHKSWKTWKITNSFSRSWKCPWILQNQEMSLEKILPLRIKKPVNKYYVCKRKEYWYIVLIANLQ